MLCEWTNVPGAISAAAKPITTLYLRIGSPLRIARAAILLPAGTWLRHVSPSRSRRAPIGRSLLAMRTLSFSWRRMASPAAGFSLISIKGISRCAEEVLAAPFTLRASRIASLSANGFDPFAEERERLEARTRAAWAGWILRAPALQRP